MDLAHGINYNLYLQVVSQKSSASEDHIDLERLFKLWRNFKLSQLTLYVSRWTGLQKLKIKIFCLIIRD